MTERNIVLRVEDDMDRRDIYATTYQMRNPFHSFRDGVASELDVFNYFSLAFAADLCPQGGRVLDLCCGRGLIIPFLRYRQGQPTLYVGVDLSPKNAIWKDGLDPRERGGVEKKGGWGFDLVFVEASVGEMLEPLREELDNPNPVFDLITYTSAIEHMQPDVQQASLQAAAEVAHQEARLYLTCPVTEEGRNGYDCQYRAHVYEPKDSELKGWLTAAGWRVDQEIGLSTKVSALKDRLTSAELFQAREIMSEMPRELALPVLAKLYPHAATEKAYICSLVGSSHKPVGKQTSRVVRTPPADGKTLMAGLE